MSKQPKKGLKSFSFADIGNLINTNIKGTSIKIEDSTEKVELISTGIYIVDAMISKNLLNGGIPSNRITVFAGESSTGKSYLCYSIAREAQKQGWSVIYIDTEFAIELGNLENYGIDISEEKFMLIRTNVIEDLKIFLTRLLTGLKEQ